MSIVGLGQVLHVTRELFQTPDNDRRPRRVIVTVALSGFVPTLLAMAVGNFILQKWYMMVCELVLLAGCLILFYLNRRGWWRGSMHMLLLLLLILNAAACKHGSDGTDLSSASSAVTTGIAAIVGVYFQGLISLAIIIGAVAVEAMVYPLTVWRIVVYISVALGFFWINSQIHRYYSTIRNLYRRLESVQEVERERMARELHDDIVQRLVTIIYQVDLQDIAPEKAVPIVEAVRDIERRLRGVIRNLYPLELDGTLATAIHCLPVGSIQLTVNVDPEVETSLPSKLKLTVYRIIQEAVFNVVKHAKASKVVVDLSLANDYLRVQVIDDGVGFDVAAVQHGEHYGLRTMRERLSGVDGDLHIDSGSQGTRLLATVPLGEHTAVVEPRAYEGIVSK